MAYALCCDNIRNDRSFAVATADKHWRDVSEEDMLGILSTFWDVQTSQENSQRSLCVA